MNDFPVSGELRTVKKRSHTVFTLFGIIIAVLSAMILWLYVLGYDSPNYEKEFTVEVSVEGESALRADKGYTILSDFGFSVKVTVSGSQTEVNKLKAEDIKAYIDVSGVSSPGNNYLPIYVVLPNENKLAVAEKSAETAVVYIDKCVVAEIPVKVDVTGYVMPDEFTLGDYTVNPVTVTVQGPETELSKIDYAYASIVPGEISGAIKANAPVALYTAGNTAVNNGYITLLDPSVEVSMPVYKTADIPVKVYFVGGYFGTDSAVITLSHDHIKVKGLAEDVDKLEEIRINVAENTLNSDTVVKRIVLPEGVESADGVTSVTATIVFNELVRRTFTAPSSAVCRFTNVPEGINFGLVTTSFSVTVIGAPEAVAAVNYSDLSVVVDLDGLELKPGGSYYLPAAAFLADGISGVFIVGEYGAEIKVYGTNEDEKR